MHRQTLTRSLYIFQRSTGLAIWMLLYIMRQCEGLLQYEPPPQYSENDLPITSFTCAEKTMGVYYADYETQCQMFHLCVRTPGFGIQNFRFLCPNYTLFDQDSQICDDWYNIDCDSSYHNDNFDLYKIGSENLIKTSKQDSKKNTPISTSTYVPLTLPLNERGKKFQEINDLDDEGLRGSDSGNFFSSKFEKSRYNDINENNNIDKHAATGDITKKRNSTTRNTTFEPPPVLEKNSKPRQKENSNVQENSYRPRQENLAQTTSLKQSGNYDYRNDNVNRNYPAINANNKPTGFKDETQNSEFNNGHQSSFDNTNLPESQKYDFKQRTSLTQQGTNSNANAYRNGGNNLFKQQQTTVVAANQHSSTLPPSYSQQPSIQYDTTIPPGDDLDQNNNNNNPYIIKATINPYLINSKQTAAKSLPVSKTITTTTTINYNTNPDDYYRIATSFKDGDNIKYQTENDNKGQQRKILKTIKPVNKNNANGVTSSPVPLILINTTANNGANVAGIDESFYPWTKYFSIPLTTTPSALEVTSTARLLNNNNNNNNNNRNIGEDIKGQQLPQQSQFETTSNTNLNNKKNGHQKDEYDYAYYDDAAATDYIEGGLANPDFSKTTV